MSAVNTDHQIQYESFLSPQGCCLLYLLLCHPATEPCWDNSGEESVRAAKLPLPSECCAATNPREEVVSVTQQARFFLCLQDEEEFALVTLESSWRQFVCAHGTKMFSFLLKVTDYTKS